MSRSVPDLATVESLDHDEMLEGYWDGFAGEPEPGNNRSDAYWHGWRNGAGDSGRRKIDHEQWAIASQFVSRSRRWGEPH